MIPGSRSQENMNVMASRMNSTLSMITQIILSISMVKELVMKSLSDMGFTGIDEEDGADF